MRPLFICLLLFVLTQSCHTRKPNADDAAKKLLGVVSKDPGINAGDMRYSFDLPAGWSRRLDTTLQGISITYLLHEPTDDFRPVINVSNEWMHSEGHQEYVNGTRQNISNSFEVEFVAAGALTTRSGKALWYSYNRIFNGIKRACVFYSIDINGISYNITAGVIADGMPTYRPVFDDIVKSFAVGKDFNKADSSFAKWMDSTR